MLVLVVEDDPLIRMTAAMLLSEAGYEVREADNADDALVALECEPGRFTHLFTDVRMPGAIDGLQLAETVCERWPHIQVVITSGKPDVRRDDALPFCARFIDKPWNSIDVLNVVI